MLHTATSFMCKWKESQEEFLMARENVFSRISSSAIPVVLLFYPGVLWLLLETENSPFPPLWWLIKCPYQSLKKSLSDTLSWVLLKSNTEYYKVYARESEGLFGTSLIELFVVTILREGFSIWVLSNSSDVISERGAAIISTQEWELGGSDRVCVGESSWTESAAGWGSEGLLESVGTDTELGCEEEVESDRGGVGGGRSDPASEREGEATVKGTGTETASVSVTEVAGDWSLCVGAKESEGRGGEFNSVCEVINIVVLLAWWLTSTSSGSELSCSNSGQNGSSTCRNTRGIILQTRHSRQQRTLTHTHTNTLKLKEDLLCFLIFSLSFGVFFHSCACKTTIRS